jgi:flagellar hook-basal body complex protein FliE
LQEHIGPVLKERDELVARVHTIQQENDQIKLKFAKLLDQFQEYVNENELKLQEEEYKIRHNQELVLHEMQCSIKELE